MTRILIVEDEGIIANNLADNLQKSGYEVVRIASSGEEALKVVSELKPDLLLMDIHLSGTLDGIETAERIRSGFSIPVIFLTAHAGQEVLDRAKRTCPFGYLVKPIRQADLVSAVEIAVYKNQMEQQLRQRDAWLVTTLRCAGDGVIVTDAGGRIEFLNDLSKRLLRIEHHNVIGSNFCDVVPLKNRLTGVRVGDLVQLAILQGAAMNIGQGLILLDQFQQDLDLEGEVALAEVNGAIVGTVFTFRDVTNRNYQDEQRRQNVATRACARLAGAVSNELTHLNESSVPDNNLVPLRTEAGDSVEAVMARHRESISRMIDRLDLVRSTQASFPKVVDLNALIEETCRQLHSDIHANFSLTSQLQPELDPIYADPIQIKQAITSLIVHSQDSMGTGGEILISTQACDVERHSGTGEAQHFVRLTVNNSSAVMTAYEAHRLFEPFSGADRSADRLNLELFIVHVIIRDAGGTIRAKAMPNQGLTFEIILPRRVGKRAGASLTIPDPAPRQKGTVILIHADPAIRVLLSETLERTGYESLGAHDFAGALEWMAIGPGSIDLLVGDVDGFPMSDPAMAEQISVLHPEMRVVLTTDHSIAPAVETFWKERGGRFLQKPFRPEELLRIVIEMTAERHSTGSHNVPEGPEYNRSFSGRHAISH